MSVEAYKLSSPQGAELHITVVPSPGSAAEQAREAFGAAAEVMRQAGATILLERVFSAPDALTEVLAARTEALGELDDGVPPSLLQVTDSRNTPVAGVQFHAVACNAPVETAKLDDDNWARIVRSDDRTLVTVSGLSVPQAGSAVEQAHAMLTRAEAAARVGGGDMFSVARTWMWLNELLTWYDDFNGVRNNFFRERGLLRANSDHYLPASTGISMAAAQGGACSMDMVAIVESGEESHESQLAGGDQGPASDYGSAFSRALKADTLAGPTVYVSGTAAIDAEGNTECVGDHAAQVSNTIAHARAVLGDMGCGDEDVVQSMIYCKTPEVEQAFHDQFGDLCWPKVVVVCDICRDDLLFEVEAMACPTAQKL